MRNHSPAHKAGFFFALLLLLATITPAYAAPDDPQDNGFGLAYDSLRFDILGYSPLTAGESQAIVTKLRWSDGRDVEPEAGIVILITRWPRAANDEARAQDAGSFAKVEQRGLAIVGYHVPENVLLPGEKAVSATLEMSAVAFRMWSWPRAGFAKTELPVLIGRNE